MSLVPKQYPGKSPGMLRIAYNLQVFTWTGSLWNPIESETEMVDVTLANLPTVVSSLVQRALGFFRGPPPYQYVVLMVYGIDERWHPVLQRGNWEQRVV